jgi:hypothetical protein
MTKRTLLWLVWLVVMAGYGCQENSGHEASQVKMENSQVQTEKRDSVPSIPEVKQDPYWDELGQFLAGFPVDSTSPFYPLTTWQTWKEYRAFIERSWNEYEKHYLIPFREWARRNVDDCRDSTLPVFYPFSGPDWVSVQALYPGHPVYVFFGLEPEGHIQRLRHLPEQWTPAIAKQNLVNLEYSLDEILRLNFFKTKEMAVELRRVWLDGATPLLLLFFKRCGYTILWVERIEVDSLMQEIPISDSVPFRYSDRVLTGVRIFFQAPNSKQVFTLYFFNQDVRDAEMEKFPFFLKWLQQRLDRCCSFTKAASYLMHYPQGYLKMRDFILNHSQLHVQDDTGIPYRHWDRLRWELRFYGNYAPPIPLFREFYQPDLADQYRQDSTIPPLSFGIGYHLGVKNASLMVACLKKKKG